MYVNPYITLICDWSPFGVAAVERLKEASSITGIPEAPRMSQLRASHRVQSNKSNSHEMTKIQMTGKRGSDIQPTQSKRTKVELKHPSIISSGCANDDDFVDRMPNKEEFIGPNVKAKDKNVKREVQNTPSIRTRSSPKSLFDGIKCLSDEQKECVRSMGFGQMLLFGVDSIPVMLGFYVVDNFDPQTMSIKLEHGSIKITKEAIKELIGVPIGGVWVHYEDDRKADKTISKLWRCNYKAGEVSPVEIASRLSTYRQADWLFRLDFVMLFTSIMVGCARNGKCKMCLLSYITEDCDVSKLDWYSLIHSQLAKCKDDWKRDDPDCYFIGPLTLLTLLYVDATRCKEFKYDNDKLALAYWSMEKLKERQKIELECGGFGKGVIREKYAHQPVDNSDAQGDKGGNIKSTDKLKMVVCKFGDLLSSMTRDKQEFEMVMKDALVQHPHNIQLESLCSKYETMFGKFNVSGSTREDDNVGNKGKELVVADDVTISQFWSDSVVVNKICDTVDRVAEKFKLADVGTSSGLVEQSFCYGPTQGFTNAECITPLKEDVETHADEGDDHVPLNVIMKRLTQENKSRAMSKRVTRVSNLLSSPYRVRPVDIHKRRRKKKKKFWDTCGEYVKKNLK